MINRASLIYISIYSIWLFLMQMMSTTYSELLFDTVEYYKIFTIVSFFLLLFGFVYIYKLNYDYIYKDIIVILIFSLVIFYSKTFGILTIYALFFILAKYIPFNKILISYIFVFLGVAFIVFLGWLLEILPEINELNASFREDGKYRYSLGYTYTTFLPNYFFHAALAWVTIRSDRISVVEILFLLLANYAIYEFTDTKAVYYLINLLSLFIFVVKILAIHSFNKGFLSYFIKIGVYYCFPILCLLSIYLHSFYKPEIEWMSIINSILADRLNLGHKGFIDYGITLFGSDVQYISFDQVTEDKPYFFLDSSYQRILINFGVVPIVFLLLAAKKLSDLVIVKNNIYLAISLIFLFGHSFTDPQLLDPIFNPFSLIFSYIYSEIGRNNL